MVSSFFGILTERTVRTCYITYFKKDFIGKNNRVKYLILKMSQVKLGSLQTLMGNEKASEIQLSSKLNSSLIYGNMLDSSPSLKSKITIRSCMVQNMQLKKGTQWVGLACVFNKTRYFALLSRK